MGYSCTTLLRDTLVRHSSGTLLRDTLVGLSSSSQTLRALKLYYKVASSHLPAPQIFRVLKLYYKVASSQLPAPQIAPRTRVVLQSRQFSASSVLKLYYKVASSQLPAPQIAPRTKVVLPSHQFSSSSSQIPRVLKLYYKVTKSSVLACTRQARSPQRVARCARMGQIALSPAFRTLDTHDLRRGLRVKSPKRAFCTRLPQKLTRQSLQNERFVRDFLQKSSGNTHRSTRITQPCQANNIRSHANPNVTATFTSTTTHNLTIPCSCHEFSPSTRLTRTKYCACHEMSPPSHLATSRFPAPATRIALPRFKARTKSCACHEK